MRYILLAALVCLLSACGGKTKSKSGGSDTITLAPCPTFDPDTCLKFIQEQCNFGPRVTGSKESALCKQYLMEQFKRLGAVVEEQPCKVTIWDGTVYSACNIIAKVNPESTDRILFCGSMCHDLHCACRVRRFGCPLCPAAGKFRRVRSGCGALLFVANEIRDY